MSDEFIYRYYAFIKKDALGHIFVFPELILDIPVVDCGLLCIESLTSPVPPYIPGVQGDRGLLAPHNISD
jgi:hypothetical protein